MHSHTICHCLAIKIHLTNLLLLITVSHVHAFDWYGTKINDLDD